MMNPFRPPLIRSATGALDRSLFSKTVRLAAAAVADNRRIAEGRRELQRTREILVVDRIQGVRPHPDEALAARGTKCLLLDPKVQAGVPETWSAPLRDAVENKELGLVPYELALNYDYWLYDDVMQALIPPEKRDMHDGIPQGFNSVGHIAHLNLREAYLPYKKLIAEVLLDKNPQVQTVINKIADVGTESEFRTFAYEVLAGPDDLNVEVRENECVFRFDYSKVYWNSKLHGEHTRLIDMFKPGEVVCDVMAGIGPFAVPAGKKGVFVWANDYNPESYRYLDESIKRNKVGEYVRAFNRDGRVFIREAADSVYAANKNGEHAVVAIARKEKRSRRPDAAKGDAAIPPPEPKRIPIPATISHFVMNLPASAITFLPHFRGLYAGHEELFARHTGIKLPVVHVHCFAPKADDDGPILEVCERISAELGVKVLPGDPEENGRAAVHNVRTVAPKKDMFCASFRLPAEVAFAPRP
ncbi:hypothetical protein DL765_011014 [Monosporascus sp. GIB2]|nr:hypothetical protein DL765_011014 [Monosporascus sp. GIB2]